MKMAKICYLYSQNLSQILVLTCPVSYHSSTLGHFDQEYLKIQNNGQKWSKIYTFSAIASKQSANNQKTHNETTWDVKNSVSAIQPNWLDTVSQTVQKIQHFKVGKSAKISHFFYFFVKKIKKLALFHHFYSQHLSLIQFVTCPVSYQASTQGPIDIEYLKIKKKQAKIGQKRPPNYTYQAIAGKQYANNPITQYQTKLVEKNTGSVIRTNWLDTVGPILQEILHFEV